MDSDRTPGKKWRAFLKGTNRHQYKFGTSNPRMMGRLVRVVGTLKPTHLHYCSSYLICQTSRLLDELKSQEFIRFLERITRVPGLLSDPFDEGGGVHVIERGGFLKVAAVLTPHFNSSGYYVC
jgi:hypothetical protein